MDDAQQKPLHVKGMNEVNYQIMEGSKERDCGIKDVFDDTPMAQEGEPFTRNSEVGTNNGKNIKANKPNQGSQGEGCIHKIIDTESEKADENISPNVESMDIIAGDDNTGDDMAVDNTENDGYGMADNHLEDEHTANDHPGDEHTEDEHTEDDHPGDEHTDDHPGNEHAEDENAEDDYAEDDYAEDDYAEDEHVEDNNAEGDYAEDDYAEGGNAEDENAEDENAEDDYAEDDYGEEDNAEDENADENTEDENAEDENAEDDNPEDDNAEDDNAEDENAEDDHIKDDNTEDDSTEDDLNDETDIVEFSEMRNICWSPVARGSGKRKSHKSYVISWKTQISCDGFAKCLIESCNFISLDVRSMQNHYKTCNGIPNYASNLCDFCNCWLNSQQEWTIHESKCRTRTKSFLRESYRERDSDDPDGNQLEMQDDNDIGLCEENIEEDDIKYCDECEQEFLSDVDYSEHMACKRNSDDRYTTTEESEEEMSEQSPLEENIDDDEDDCPIVQPGRSIPKGEYVRRRSYTRQHKNAWETAIEKYKYVKCIFQNCHFLALSVDDMISHYGYCNGDGSFAKCVCPYCGGRLTSKTFLEYHIRKSHASEDYDENYFINTKTPNDASDPSPTSENKESSGDEPEDLEELEPGFPEEAPLDAEATEESTIFDSQEPLTECVNEETATESDDLQQDIKSESNSQAQTWESTSECSQNSTNARDIGDPAVEELNLPQEHSLEPSAVDTSQGNSQKLQCPTKSRDDTDVKEDHIYSKRKFKSTSDFESKNTLSVKKNKNSKHYSVRKHMSEETLTERESNNKNEDQLYSNKTVSGSGEGGKLKSRSIKNPFPLSQTTIKREILPAYTKLWSEGIRTNGFARCLVATCNFISLDIFHIENHFKNCRGVVERGPNLCKFCDSRLPSAVELWIHSSMCKANGEVIRSLSDGFGKRNKGDGSNERIITGESSNTAEMAGGRKLLEKETQTQEEYDSSKSNRDDTGDEIGPRKEKMGSLRISDIIKLKDNGGMDYDRIIQPGPVMPEGHYVRRRSYTKTHKVVWEAALAKHKYVKCIFQNCHFLAMSLEDMIYHFGYCIGDGSFAKYECPHCGGRLTSKMILDIHIQISHSDKTSNENDPNKMTSNEEGEELPTYSVEDWKKIIAKKELKTYGKSSPRSKKVRSQSGENVTTEYLLETSQDDDSNPEVPALKKRKCHTQTASEIEADEDSESNNSTADSTSNEVYEILSAAENRKRKRNNVNIKSSEFQTSREPKLCKGLRSKKTNEKIQAGTSKVTDKGKTADLGEVLSESDTSRDTSTNILRTPKSACSTKENSDINCEKRDSCTHENPNYEENSSNVNTSTISLVGEKNSNKETQKTENENREKTKAENKNSNKSDQKTKNDTELNSKEATNPKSLNEEDLLEKGPAKEVLDDFNPEEIIQEANDCEGSQESHAKPAEVEPLQSQSNPNETANLPHRKRGRPPKRKFFESKLSEGEENKAVEETPEQSTKGKRGRKKKCETQENSETSENKDANYVKCAQCGFETKRRMFSDHNYKKHVGLSWIEGENPIDLNDERVVSWNIKQAFKHVKSGTCGKCGSVKKSALGFISHIQNCGKSEEEKEALKVKCPHCPARILKYSLPMHLKLSHSDSEGCKVPKNVLYSPQVQPSKRKSALRAVNKFNELLKQEGDIDEAKKKVQYVVYEKGVSKFPKLPSKIRSLWNKMIKEKKKIPCRRGSCLVESSTIEEARNHHFLCSELPHMSYVCELCDYYTESKTSIQEHVDIHPNIDGDFRIESGEEKSEEEVEINDLEEEESDLVQTRSRNYVGSSDDNAIEAAYKARFFARERLLNERQTRFCRHSLRMTLESEMEEAKKSNSFFPELHTEASDWIHVKPENASGHFPSLKESISFRIMNKKSEDESNWKKIKRFMGEIVDDSAVIFTGGSVLSMSWCKYSCIRSSKEHPEQYLAVSSSKKMDKFQNIHKKRTDNYGLIQIYSCGEMNNLNDMKAPEMVIGIVHDYGEVWDLAWFPLDACEDYEDEPFLTRIGLIGAACQDGTIRIWPICDPDELKPVHSLPMYKVQPKITLELENTADVACMKLAIGKTGIVVGGYTDGIIAVWSLKNISSPFCKRNGKNSILKPHINFQAHKTSITALAICQNNDRYISTSGLDRFIKFWDLEYPGNPFESVQKEVCLDSVWPQHWPLTISTFENVVPSSGKGMIKAIRDIYCDKHRTPLVLEGSCWSLSFNEWLNVLCGCNNFGDVKIRFMRNMFVGEEKFRYRTGNVFSTTELKLLKDTRKEKLQEDADAESSKGNSKKNAKKAKENLAVPTTYEEASKYFGLIFHDFPIEDDSKLKTTPPKANKKEGQSLEEYPIVSVNKVCWNPNYKRFLQLAIGHHCGLIRIKALNDSKCTEEVLRFLSESEKEISKFSSK